MAYVTLELSLPGSGGINIDTNCRLVNNNAILKSNGSISLFSNGALENTTGKISSSKTIFIDTKNNQVKNTQAANIVSSENVYISSGEFNNTNGRVAAVETVGLNTNKKTLINTGQRNSVGSEAGVVAIQ